MGDMHQSSKTRICLIGAGPSGMSVLYHAARVAASGRDVPEIVCYEKQSDWGGQWNYTWRTGTDENAQPVHSSMYRYLWSNGPKEAIEYPDYTFEHHYGHAIPSFPPREVLFDYMKGRWKSYDLRKHIKFCHPVKHVGYDDATKEFLVTVVDVNNDNILPPERFDWVLVASGHFSMPHVPTFPGIERFPGRVMHAHDFRDAREFQGKRLLLVGASYSAEDIGMQLVKYGAEHVTCTYRTKPMGFKWPDTICERPLLTHFDDRTVHFSDGSTDVVDSVLMCTGYLPVYPFMAEELRLKSPNIFYPAGLYKGTVFLGGGNNKCLYIGAQDQYYTFTMFDAQAHYALKYILGDLTLPDHDHMTCDSATWVQRLTTLKDGHEAIDFQTDFVQDLAKESGYGYDLDVAGMFHEWYASKKEAILEYRDKSYTCKFTGTKSPIHHSTFMAALDDSLECYLNKPKM